MNKIPGCNAKYLMITALAVWWLYSCSVKEDRTVCPCLLEVVFPDKGNDSGRVLLEGWTTDEVFRDEMTLVGKQDTIKLRVPRTMIHFSAVAGLAQCERKGHVITVPEGSQSDSLYGYIDYVDCTGETAYTEVNYHKQFATVTIQIINESFPSQDYSFVVSSGSSGLDILSLQAVAGQFKHQLKLEEGKRMVFRLPRQGDDSLVLLVAHISGDSVQFPLGQFIRNMGYDWDATDLKDIFITIDISRNQVTIGVAGWENAAEYELSMVEM